MSWSVGNVWVANECRGQSTESVKTRSQEAKGGKGKEQRGIEIMGEASAAICRRDLIRYSKSQIWCWCVVHPVIGEQHVGILDMEVCWRPGAWPQWIRWIWWISMRNDYIWPLIEMVRSGERFREVEKSFPTLEPWNVTVCCRIGEEQASCRRKSSSCRVPGSRAVLPAHSILSDKMAVSIPFWGIHIWLSNRLPFVGFVSPTSCFILSSATPRSIDEMADVEMADVVRTKPSQEVGAPGKPQDF